MCKNTKASCKVNKSLYTRLSYLYVMLIRQRRSWVKVSEGLGQKKGRRCKRNRITPYPLSLPADFPNPQKITQIFTTFGRRVPSSEDTLTAETPLKLIKIYEYGNLLICTRSFTGVLCIVLLCAPVCEYESHVI